MADINARTRLLTGTTAQWAANNLVIGNGELVVERASGPTLKLKVGDGATAYGALPFVSAVPIIPLEYLTEAEANALYVPLTGVSVASAPNLVPRMGADGKLAAAMIPLPPSVSTSVGAADAGKLVALDAAGRVSLTMLTPQVNASAGVADAAKVVLLDATGKISPTMIEVTTGGYLGTADLTAALPAGSYVAGDYFINTTAGTAHVSWGLGAVAVAVGQQVIYDGATWDLIGTGAAYLPLSGGTLTGGLTVATASTDIDPLDTGFPATPNGLTVANSQVLTGTYSALSLTAIEDGGRNAVISLVAQSVAGSYQPNLRFIQRNTGTGIERMQLDGAGRLLLGTSASITNRQSGSAISPSLQVAGTTSNVGMGTNVFAANSSTPGIYLGKSRGATVGSHAVVPDGEVLGLLVFNGSDGTEMREAARIMATVSGAVAASSVPGMLNFYTTPPAGTIPTVKMQIGPSGEVGIGAGPTVGQTVRIAKPLTGATNSQACVVNSTVQADVTASAYSFYSNPSTVAAAFALTGLHHFRATQGTLGAGSSIVNQYGFFVDSNLTSAASNYSFYSNMTPGAGRWGVYINGSCDNFMAGGLGLGVAPGAAYALDVEKSQTLVRLRSTNAAGYTGARLWNDQNSAFRGMEWNYAGSAYASALLGGGPVGEQGTLATTGAYPLVLGTNNTARLVITGAGVIQDGAGFELGFKGLPAASVSTGAFAASDRGKCVYATAGVTVPNAVMAGGDVVVIANTTAAPITITQGASHTMRQSGTANIGNRTLAAYGLATVLFINPTASFITGTGLS